MSGFLPSLILYTSVGHFYFHQLLEIWAIWRQRKHVSANPRMPPDFYEFPRIYPEEEYDRTIPLAKSYLLRWIQAKFADLVYSIVLFASYFTYRLHIDEHLSPRPPEELDGVIRCIFEGISGGHFWNDLLLSFRCATDFFRRKEVMDDVVACFWLYFILAPDPNLTFILTGIRDGPAWLRREAERKFVFIYKLIFHLMLMPYFQCGILLVTLYFAESRPQGVIQLLFRTVLITGLALLVLVCKIEIVFDRKGMRRLPPLLPFHPQARALCRATGFPFHCVKVLTLLRRDNWNAYCSSRFFGKKNRIVFYPGLIQGFPNNPDPTKGLDIKDLRAVLAHETGHWAGKHHYSIKRFILRCSAVLYFFIILTVLQGDLIYEAFSFRGGRRPILTALVLSRYLVFKFPYDVCEIFTYALSRENEKDADRYATRLLKGEYRYLKTELLKITTQIRQVYGWYAVYPMTDKWFEILMAQTHPSLLDRMRDIEETSQWVDW